LAVVKAEGMLHSISNLQQTFQQENVTSTIQQNPENKHVPDQFVPGSYHGVYSNGQVNSCSLETEDIVVGKRHQLPTSSNGSDRKEYIKGRRRKQGSSTMLRSKVDFDGIKRMYSSNSAAGQEFRQDYVPIFNALDQRGYGQMIRFCSRFGIPFLGRGPLRSIRWAVNSKDIRYQISFLNPQVAAFDPMQKIGVLMVDMLRGRMVDNDSTFREIFKTNLTSPIGSRQALFTMKNILFTVLFPMIFSLKIGEWGWIRQYLLNGAGEAKWYLCRVVKVSQVIVKVETQDLSNDEFIRSLGHIPLLDEPRI